MKKVLLTRPRRASTTDSVIEARRNNQKKPGDGNGDVSPLKGGYIHPPSPRAADGKEKKEKPTVDSILADTELLTSQERKQLIARLALNQQISTKGSDRDLDMWATAAYDGLVQELGHEAGAQVGPILVKRSLASPSAWAPVAAFMASSKLQEQSVTKRQAIYMMLAKLVIQNAKFIARKSGAPMSAKLIASCAANISSLFDNAFPGYLKSGLAHIVAIQLTAMRQGEEA